jgi:subtilisin family serine protease
LRDHAQLSKVTRIMSPLELVKVNHLMQQTSGRPEIKIGLIDGPVAVENPDLNSVMIQNIHGRSAGRCTRAESDACIHGTFVAGILSARRTSCAPAICPKCTLLVRPIFSEKASATGEPLSATSRELATAIVDCVPAGARVINLSLALIQSSTRGEHELQDSLDYATARDVLVVAAAGNQGSVGGSTITSHPWVIPVVAGDLSGRPIRQSNLGTSIGRYGLIAPGESITSLGTDEMLFTSSGTSAAAPFVTGVIALLWSQYPTATASQLKAAVSQGQRPWRASVVPSLLNALRAHQVMSQIQL